VGTAANCLELANNDREPGESSSTERPMKFRHTILSACALLTLVSCASTTKTDVTPPPTGAAEDFFKGNPDVVDHGQLNHRRTEPSYLLVSSADYDALDQRYQAQGYVRIGESNWTGGLDGTPERELALNYARKIGADRVLYYCTGSTEWVEGMQRTDHNIRFYAKTDQSSVPTVTTSKVN
jgi:hypothetical protein